MNKGPYSIKTPSFSAETCVGCEWFTQNLKRSGKHPEYRCNCIHPLITGMFLPSLIPPLIGNLDAHYNYEHHFPETPGWCPVKKEEAP